MNEFQDVKTIVDADVQFLLKLGYTLIDKEFTDDNVLGRRLKWVYSARKLDREITLYYKPFGKDGPECFSVFIGASDRPDYILEELFKRQNKGELNRIFYNFEKSVSGAAFCHRFLDGFRQLVEGEIFSIVSGAEWVDVQIDWSPYR